MFPIFVFDVNETLLDLSALDPLFDHHFGDAAVRKNWFDYALRLAFVSTITGPYADFSSVVRAALRAVEEQNQQTLTPEQRFEITDSLGRLPAHPDVKEGLRRLRDQGYEMVALTNSTGAVAGRQLEHAGLTDYFARIFSADTVKRLKPAPEPYRMAAEKLKARTDNLCLVAAHAWDTTGAIRAGCRAVFVARPGQVLDPLSPKPDAVVSDLLELAQLFPRETRAA